MPCTARRLLSGSVPSRTGTAPSCPRSLGIGAEAPLPLSPVYAGLPHLALRPLGRMPLGRLQSRTGIPQTDLSVRETPSAVTYRAPACVGAEKIGRESGRARVGHDVLT